MLMLVIRKILLHSSTAIKAHKRTGKKDIKMAKGRLVMLTLKRMGLVNKETNKGCVFVYIPLTLFGFSYLITLRVNANRQCIMAESILKFCNNVYVTTNNPFRDITGQMKKQ